MDGAKDRGRSMIELSLSNYLLPTKNFRILSILFAINESPESSQHMIARKTNLSSSMVNNYIKILKSGQLIYSSGNTNRTQSYHLTKKGNTELSSQFFSYSAEIVQMYSAIKSEIKKVLRVYYERGIRNIILFGASETAEIVYTVLKDLDFSIVGVVDGDLNKVGERFNGCTIQKSTDVTEMKSDAIVISSFGRQQEIYKFLQGILNRDQEIIKLTDLDLNF